MKQKKSEAQSLLVMEEGLFWAHIQDAAHNAVVQIVSQVAPFNWLEPYKVEERFEVRGSGFIIDKAGHIITNMHVIKDATHIWIHIPALGRNTINVELLSACPDNDIALLKIVPRDLKKIKEELSAVPFLAFGDSDALQRAESVMSLGYPLGQSRLKSTTGVVSGRESEFGQLLIQTTAPINPGSSGGPLLNLKGQVIGVTLAMALDSYNVGYALPSNDILIILEDLFAIKLVRKPMLGGRFVYANDKKAELLGNPQPAGLYVSTVFPHSLLEQVGIRSGDMLYQMGGYTIDQYGETRVPWAPDKVSLVDLVNRLRVGDTIKFVFYRNGIKKQSSLTVSLHELFAIRTRYPNYEDIEYQTLGGLVIMEMTDNHIHTLADEMPDLITYLRPENKLQSRLLITAVLPGSYMHQLRSLRPGLIITHVNNKPVNTLQDLSKALLGHKDSLVSITTDYDILVAFDIKEVLAEEKRLHFDYGYPICSLTKELYKKYKMA